VGFFGPRADPASTTPPSKWADAPRNPKKRSGGVDWRLAGKKPYKRKSFWGFDIGSFFLAVGPFFCRPMGVFLLGAGFGFSIPESPVFGDKSADFSRRVHTIDFLFPFSLKQNLACLAQRFLRFPSISRPLGCKQRGGNLVFFCLLEAGKDGAKNRAFNLDWPLAAATAPLAGIGLGNCWWETPFSLKLRVEYRMFLKIDCITDFLVATPFWPAGPPGPCKVAPQIGNIFFLP